MLRSPRLDQSTGRKAQPATGLIDSIDSSQLPRDFRRATSARATAASGPPTTSSGPRIFRRSGFCHTPKLPQVVLYDQYNNAGANATSSQDFEAAFDPFDNFTADDFVVPGGESWSVESIDADGVYFNGPGPAASFHVSFLQRQRGPSRRAGRDPHRPAIRAGGQHL